MAWSIVQHGTKFLIWSSVVDAPITYGGTWKQLVAYWRKEWGRRGVENLLERQPPCTVEDVAGYNRAGADETQLNADQIIDYYFVRKGVGEQPTGTDPYILTRR